MIQRKQSIYLLLGSLALGGALFFSGTARIAFSGYAPVAFGAGALIGLLGLAAIFMYGNRQRQHAAAFAAQLGALLWMALFTAALYISGDAGAGGEGGGLVPMGLLVCSYAFFWLARRAIRADIELARSADRIR